MKRLNDDVEAEREHALKRPKKTEVIEILDDSTNSEIEAPKQDTLSESQSRALACVLEGKNVFITGGAGTGKSYLIERIKKKLGELGKCYYTTATTGSAAYNVAGTTLHHYAGIGLGEGTVDKIVENFKRYKEINPPRWIDTDVLIIDEISMLATDYFDKINEVAKGVREEPYRAFGGIQVIMVGDMAQLPSIQKKGKEIDRSKRYVFQTHTWKELRPVLLKLDFNFRQQGDDVFKDLLNSIRFGKLTAEAHALLASRDVSRLKEPVNEEEMTKLFAYRADVQRVNSLALEKIDAPIERFQAKVYFCDTLKKKHDDLLARGKTIPQPHYPVDDVIELKVGAAVLLCYNLNMDAGLYNGCRGEVISFELAPSKAFTAERDVKYPRVRFYNGEVRIITPHTWEQKEHQVVITSFTQIPLMLAYSCTIHKSQGLTLTNGLVNTKCFETGQFYVAVSRFRELKDLHFTNFLSNKNIKGQIMADPIVIKFYEDNNLM